METPDGRISVAPVRILQLEPDANRVVVDRGSTLAQPVACDPASRRAGDLVEEHAESQTGELMSNPTRRRTGRTTDRSTGESSGARLSCRTADSTNGRTNGNSHDGAIDAPNSARLRQQVLHRDGMKCANPACGRKGDLQAHHIVYRSRGGRTALANEVTVCSTCHALIHAARLEVTGTQQDGLKWTPRPLDPAARVRGADDMREGSGAGGDLRGGCGGAPGFGGCERAPGSCRRDRGPGSCRHDRGQALADANARQAPYDPKDSKDRAGVIVFGGRASPQSPMETAISPGRFQDLAHGLHRFGYSVRDAKAHLGKAIVELLAEAQARHASGGLLPEPLTDEQIMMRALRGRGEDGK